MGKQLHHINSRMIQENAYKFTYKLKFGIALNAIALLM